MSEWIEWAGGECPVAHNIVVEVKLRNGKQTSGPRRADSWSWDYYGISNDIIAYRIVKEKEE